MRLTDGVPIEAPIRPVCEALTAAGCATVYSCGAHLTARPRRPRAYVTFACGETAWVAALVEWVRAPGPALGALRRDMRFDCLLGRYTVSAWAPDGPGARVALDAGLAELTAWIAARSPVHTEPAAACTVPAGRVPALLPCRQTLGDLPTHCAWTGAPLRPA